MDKRISYKIVFDSEACPLDINFEGVDPSNMWMYDAGWAIVDKKGNIYKTRSFVNADIFLNEKELMKSAYYANKLPQYWEDIKAGKRILTSFYNISKAFKEDIKEFNVAEVYAHNMRFDYHTMNNTSRWLSKSKYRFFFPYNIQICDTLKMARDVIAPMPTYKKYCEENNYLTKAGKPRLTAEILYKFISGEDDFKESHTGLEDVLIEKEILKYCYSKHKKMRKLLYERP